MRGRPFSVIAFTFAFVFAGCLHSAVCQAQQQSEGKMKVQSPYNVPEGKKKQWESIQNMAKKEYDVCLEHCGSDSDCLVRCETAYKTRLDRAYRGLIPRTGEASAQPDIAGHATCPYCGMDRAKFAHSRVLLVYEDGSAFGACSIHCAAIDMAVNIDKAPSLMQVGDYGTKKLIDAEEAVWVLGGKKTGVMTKRAKWAFETEQRANTFILQNGGTLAAFEDAMNAAYEDMYEDTKMIRQRRKMKRKTEKK